MMISKIDLRGKSLKERERVLKEWFNHQLHCVDGAGHDWASHRWMPELKAWLWGPCRKCGQYRLTQTKGNYVVFNLNDDDSEALIVDDDFENIENKMKTLIPLILHEGV